MPRSHIIRATMNDTEHLRDKQVIFRLIGLQSVYAGIVRNVEAAGFWIEAPTLIGEMQRDAAWGTSVERVETPLVFVPRTSLMYLIAAKD